MYVFRCLLSVVMSTFERFIKHRNHTKQLYIIGNGFDLMHGIPSSYSDFGHFCKTNNKELFEMMNREFPSLSKDNNLWSNFESSLGKPDYSFLFQMAKNNEVEKLQNEDRPVGVDYPTLAGVMAKWIDSLSELIKTTTMPKKEFLNGKNSVFLTFNYTNTLEVIYGISSEICYHIHERYSDNTAGMFVGYNWGHSKCKEDISSELSTLGVNVVDVIPYEIATIVKGFGKRYEDGNRILEQMIKKTQQNVDDIIVIGHSMSEVDYCYFQTIRDNFETARWHVFYYDNIDLVKKRRSVIDLNIASNTEFISL